MLTGLKQIFAGDIDQVYDNTNDHNPGDLATDGAGNIYLFGKGVASTAQYSWVSFDEAHQSALLAADAKGRVGIAQAAIVADKYGWYLVYGTGSGKVLASFADNGLVFATATAGSVDDAAVAGDLIVGAIGRSAISGGLATMELNWPQATDNLGS